MNLMKPVKQFIHGAYATISAYTSIKIKYKSHFYNGSAVRFYIPDWRIPYSLLQIDSLLTTYFIKTYIYAFFQNRTLQILLLQGAI